MAFIPISTRAAPAFCGDLAIKFALSGKQPVKSTILEATSYPAEHLVTCPQAINGSQHPAFSVILQDWRRTSIKNIHPATNRLEVVIGSILNLGPFQDPFHELVRVGGNLNNNPNLGLSSP
jgi:hypothetical protein